VEFENMQLPSGYNDLADISRVEARIGHSSETIRTLWAQLHKIQGAAAADVDVGRVVADGRFPRRGAVSAAMEDTDPLDDDDDEEPSPARSATGSKRAAKRMRIDASSTPFLPPVAPGTSAYRVEDDWSPEVRCFYPTLGRANQAVAAACTAFDATARSFFQLDESAAVLDMPGEAFDAAPLLPGLGQAGVGDSSWDQSLIDATETLSDLREALVQARDATRRAFDMYTLATQTMGTSWLTVRQLVWRESHDASRAQYDPTHKPLATWGDKVTAALVACKQVGLTKDGALLGPVAPFVDRGHGTARRDGAAVPHRSSASTPPKWRASGSRGSPKGRHRAGPSARGRSNPKAKASRKQDAGSEKPAEKP